MQGSKGSSARHQPDPDRPCLHRPSGCQHLPRTTELWEEFSPTNKIWAAWKTAYLAAHKKRANCLRTTGGADNLGRANSAHANKVNPGLLDSIDNALDNLASAATNKKAILEQLIASNSSLATSNLTLTNQVKTLHD